MLSERLFCELVRQKTRGSCSRKKIRVRVKIVVGARSSFLDTFLVMAEPAQNPQSKVNHLVFECLQKAAGIILQARVQNDQAPSGIGERNWVR